MATHIQHKPEREMHLDRCLGQYRGAGGAHRREDNCVGRAAVRGGLFFSVQTLPHCSTCYNEHKVSVLVGRKESHYDSIDCVYSPDCKSFAFAFTEQSP